MRNLKLVLAAALGILPAAALALEAVPAAPSEEALPPSAFIAESPVDQAFRTPGKPLRSDALTVHPVMSMAISGLNLSYEFGIGQGLWSGEIPLYIGYNEKLYTNPTFFLGSGFGLRRYLLDRGAGTYVAPSLDVLNVKRWSKGPDAANNVLMVVPNLRMGYRWTWTVFTMDAALGAAYYETVATQGKLANDDPNVRGIIPMAQYSLGIPF